ncbi:MAG: NADH-quinone oxidoreductase subunit M [Bacteroidetes bacterium]|nr:NADH-quinone oxidoreductase subunit M [Bacteroidota bacterium]MBS1648416.1 NADH-quinone oxidoreductase subunit M [Bacteroidota bacterium]
MVPVWLILIPLLTGLVSFGLQNAKVVKAWALFSTIISTTLIIAGIYFLPPSNLQFNAVWLTMLSSNFSFKIDGMSKMLCLLTAISFLIIFIAINKNEYKNSKSFYALMLLMQAGFMGVFTTTDALLFYFFWELALIPAYFLCSMWGGEKRIQVTFKFFVYTFTGSLIMLCGIIYLYFQTPNQTFSLESFYNLHLSHQQQSILFWLFFIAFAIKMPMFPFHTWQPDTYEQSSTGVTMALSGVMAKMGIFAVIRWVIPIFPEAVNHFNNIIIILSTIGIVYASLIAIKQDDLKRMIAYSSIAHIGLMCAAIFSQNNMAMQGVLIQMFNHGIVVIGLWVVADAVEQQLGTRKLSELGGLAQKAPALAIFIVVLAFANVALPLASSFIGEFLMLNGLFQHNILIAAIAGTTIILSAVYTLNMVQKIFYGNTVALTEKAVDISSNIKTALIILVTIIIVLGIYPQPMLNLVK